MYAPLLFLKKLIGLTPLLTILLGESSKEVISRGDDY